MLVRAAQEKKDFQLVGLLEVNGHDLIGTKACELFPGLEKNLVVSDSLDKILKVLQVLALESNLLAVSSKEGEGMDDLYSIVQSTFAAGDDLEAHTDAN